MKKIDVKTAEKFVREQKKDPEVNSWLWFPDKKELRIAYVSNLQMPNVLEREVPFFFKWNGIDVGLIGVDKRQKDIVKTPIGWRGWKNAVEVDMDL